jgi:hypothetical protein
MAKYINQIDSQIASAPTVTVVTKQEGVSLNVDVTKMGRDKIRALAVLAVVASLLLIILAINSGKKSNGKVPTTKKDEPGESKRELIHKEHEYHHKLIQLEAELKKVEKKAKEGDVEAKKRAAVLKRQIGRYKKLIEKARAEREAKA